MRVLFASLASAGHTYPMVPLAIAAREAGHEVHFAVGEEVHAPLAANGLRPFRPADTFYEMYAEDLEPELARLRPDLVVHGWGVPGAAIAARRAGIPGLWHGFGRLFPDGIGFERDWVTDSNGFRYQIDPIKTVQTNVMGMLNALENARRFGADVGDIALARQCMQSIERARFLCQWNHVLCHASMV